ncbi:hypothetical protein EYA84_01290 [Verrucosispora sp. SN26_14.1]|uniref:hypothetical protein n=1 Tax=Verrucosispora sp. SN26_14.1 TaxID=2527879 RepID=UPI0010353915|nr:hypothetical protein [Verrucosispora sp. SN26_14.1]TBL44917.1 hypothetical protein EYA84_01290 [Verrucosispora sp. SN26_14.1]
MSDADDHVPGLAEAQRVYLAYIDSGGADASGLRQAASDYRRALSAMPGGHPLRLRATANFMACLRVLFVGNGDAALLDEAIDRGRRELARAGAQAPVPLAFSMNLAGVLNTRFQRTGNLADVDGAIGLYRAVVGCGASLRPQECVALMSNLAFTMRARYEVTGNVADLTESVELARRAYEAATGHDRLKVAYIVSSILTLRYRHFGDSDDLTEAQRLATEVVAQAPRSHVELAGYLAHLAALERDVFHRTGDGHARQRAGALYERLLHMLGTAESIRPVVMANWTLMLETATGVLDPAQWLKNDVSHRPDLGLVALMLPRLRAAARQAEGTAHQPRALAALARAHLSLDTAQQSDNDLWSAVEAATAAVRGTPFDHPDRAQWQVVAAAALLTRWNRHHRDADLEAAGEQLTAAAQNHLASPAVRIQAAHALLTVRMATGDIVGADAVSRLAVGLLPLVTWRGASRPDQEFRLAAAADISRDAAAAALMGGSPTNAVELNEAGRAVLWTGILHGRSDLSAVRTASPLLADELTRVRRALA